jgi:hypothetical protein
LGELEREMRAQLRLQRRLLKATYATAAALLVLGLGLGFFLGDAAASKLPDPYSPHACARDVYRPTVASVPVAHAVPVASGGTRAEELVERARANAEGGDIVVHRVHLSRASAERQWLAVGGTRARIMPVEVDGGRHGVRILQVPGGEDVSLLPGDTVLAINGHATSSPESAMMGYAEAMEERSVVLEVVRGGRPVVVSISWDA